MKTATISPAKIGKAKLSKRGVKADDAIGRNSNDSVQGPPSSFCGSDCLYNSVNVPIHKFFENAAKVDCADAVPVSTAVSVKTKQQDTQDEDARQAAREVGTDSAGERGRQTKFSFYDNGNDIEKHREDSSAVDDHPPKEVKVRFAMNSLLNDESFEDAPGSLAACSFASSLTTLSSNEKVHETVRLLTSPSTPSDGKPGRLSTAEHVRVLSQCKAYRIQIASFEERFQAANGGRLPSTSRERSEIADVYRSYRAAKYIVRADAAVKIQCAWRGRALRKNWDERKKLAVHLQCMRKEAIDVKVAEERVRGMVVNDGKTLDCIRSEAQRSIRELRSLQEVLQAGTTISAATPPRDAGTKKDNLVTPWPSKTAAVVTTRPSTPVYTSQEVKDESRHWIERSLSTERKRNTWVSPEITAEIRGLYAMTPANLATSPPPAIPAAAEAMAVPASNVIDNTFDVTASERDPTLEPVSDITNMAFAPNLTPQIIAHFFTPEEKADIATKALTEKLIDKSYKLPDNADIVNSGETVCVACEMPKLITTSEAETTNASGCVVCENLRREIEARQKKLIVEEEERVKKEKKEQERKVRRERKKEEKRLAKERKRKDKEAKEKLMLEDMEKVRLAELEDEKRRRRQQQQQQWTYRSDCSHLDWSASVPTTLHLPIEVPPANPDRCSHGNKEPHIVPTGLNSASWTQHHETPDWLSDVVTTLPLRPCEPQDEEDKLKTVMMMHYSGKDDLSAKSSSPGSSTDYSDSLNSDESFTTAAETKECNEKKKVGKANNDNHIYDVEKDEFDALLDDPTIEQLQRKIHNVPAPRETDLEMMAQANEKKPHDTARGSDADLLQVQQHGSYGGFATKSDYDNFQQMYGEFEKDHADVVDYIRERVAHKTSTVSLLGESLEYDKRVYERLIHGKEVCPEDGRCAEGRYCDDYQEYHNRHKNNEGSMSEITQSRSGNHRCSRNHRSHSREMHGRKARGRHRRQSRDDRRQYRTPASSDECNSFSPSSCSFDGYDRGRRHRHSQRHRGYDYCHRHRSNGRRYKSRSHERRHAYYSSDEYSSDYTPPYHRGNHKRR